VATEQELVGRIAALEEELRKQREEADTSQMILELVLRQMPAIYWIVDRDVRITRTGGAVQQILGYEADRFVGRTVQDAIASDPASGDPVGNHLRAIAGETVTYETEYRGKVFAAVIGPYRLPSGEIVGAVGTTLDVTAWRTLERRMVDAQRAESLGVLAGGLAHDFNNLLVAVLGNADLALREISEGKTARTPIESIRDAALRAAELTDQLLAYAGRGGAGTTRVEPALVVEELLRIIAPSIPPEVKVNVALPNRLAVRGDPAQFRQVLLNLINNARDALVYPGTRSESGSLHLRHGGEIAIRASLEHVRDPHPHDILSAPAGSFVMIEVEDDGPGMDAETRRHVFEPFFTTKQRGHGLGLAAVLGIVRAHGGGIRVISAPGTGTKFQLLWPAAVSQPLRAMSQPPTNAPTVLVIDDEDLVRDVVARMVEDLGYAALTAADGQSGLDVVERQPVDAVLVDLTMPHMSGADVVAALRKRRPELPVVLCSGFDRHGRGPVQADAYLAKPFRIDALEATLAKLLPLRSV
jgi:PAS domain S-box-containing protein